MVISSTFVKFLYRYNELVINTILTNIKYFIISSKFLLFKKKIRIAYFKNKRFRYL